MTKIYCACLGGLAAALFCGGGWADGPLPAPSAFVDVPIPPPSYEVGEEPQLPVGRLEMYEPVPLATEPEMLPAPPALALPEGEWIIPLAESAPYLTPSSPSRQLYPRVRVHDRLRKHPDSIPTVLAVPDPRRGETGCVCVEVCLPPCLCSEIRCSRWGNRVVYDFGRYAVVVTSRLGVVHIDYDNRNVR